MNVPELWNKTEVEKILKCQCINCGGHLETHDNIHYNCLYCETKYTVKQDKYRHRDYIIEVVHPNMITLGTRIPVPPERVTMYNLDDKETFVKREASRQLAKYIEEHFDELADVEVEYDYQYGGELYDIRMRMLHSIRSGGF